MERRSVASLALLYCFRMLGLFMVLPLLALYAADFPDASPSLIGLALGVYGLAQAVLQIPYGWLSDKIGRKPVIIAGLLLFALGSAVAAMAETVHGIVIGRTLQGAGAIASTLMALVADLTRDEQRTKAMALVGASIGFSFALALILGPVVASWGGLAGVFWFSALLAGVGIAIVVYIVPTPSAVPQVRSSPSEEVGAEPALFLPTLADPRLLRLNLGVFVLHFAMMASFLVVPQYLADSLEIARESHWRVYLPVLLLSLVGMLPLMMIAERGGRPRTVFLLSIALLWIAVAALGMGGTAGWFYVALWLFFVAFNYLEATLPSVVSKAVSAQGKGTAMGIYSSCQFLGAFTGGALGGRVLEVAGDGALIGLSVVAIAVWWLVVYLAQWPISSAHSENETERTETPASA